jgi:hypothetical protein
MLELTSAGSFAGRKQNRIQVYETKKYYTRMLILESRIWDPSMLICLRRKSR